MRPAKALMMNGQRYASISEAVVGLILLVSNSLLGRQVEAALGARIGDSFFVDFKARIGTLELLIEVKGGDVTLSEAKAVLDASKLLRLSALVWYGDSLNPDIVDVADGGRKFSFDFNGNDLSLSCSPLPSRHGQSFLDLCAYCLSTLYYHIRNLGEGDNVTIDISSMQKEIVSLGISYANERQYHRRVGRHDVAASPVAAASKLEEASLSSQEDMCVAEPVDEPKEERRSPTIDADFMVWLVDSGGEIATTYRELAEKFGCSATTVGRMLRRLTDSGVIATEYDRKTKRVFIRTVTSSVGVSLPADPQDAHRQYLELKESLLREMIQEKAKADALAAFNKMFGGNHA